MNQGGFNEPHESAWSRLDRAQPNDRGAHFDEVSRRRNENNGAWMSGEQLAAEIEQVLAGKQPMPPSLRRPRKTDPGE